MFLKQPKYRRSGFTLVELIVVITIILLLTALGAVLLPRFLDNQNQTRAVDQLSQWLLTAKQRAKRDGLPTGVRILFGDPGTMQANKLEYIQQPEPYTAGVCTSVDFVQGVTTFKAGSVDFQGAAGLIDQPDRSVIQTGDYLELNGGGSIYLITGLIDYETLTLANNFVTLSVATPNYRIIRQPRRLLGEDVLTLPQDMVIDNNTGLSVNVPVRQIAGQLTAYEILFAPSGRVIGQGTPSGKIILWVRNATNPNAYDPGVSSLVSVQVRTGFIAAHPISITPQPPNGVPDYYLFTEDGRSSGM